MNRSFKISKREEEAKEKMKGEDKRWQDQQILLISTAHLSQLGA